MLLLVIAAGIVVGFMQPVPISLRLVAIPFIVGLALSIFSAWLSVYYWKTRDPEGYLLRMRPAPGGKVVPIWVSYLNLFSWAMIVVAITWFFRR